ncbi:MAG TPA: hypothetical protein VIL74_06930 [Pyrinomonadaceae bacterium]
MKKPATKPIFTENAKIAAFFGFAGKQPLFFVTEKRRGQSVIHSQIGIRYLVFGFGFFQKPKTKSPKPN